MIIIYQKLNVRWTSGERQSLGREETQALVQAMESRTEDVFLSGEVTLDMEALSDYSGLLTDNYFFIKGKKMETELTLWISTDSDTLLLKTLVWELNMIINYHF